MSAESALLIFQNNDEATMWVNTIMNRLANRHAGDVPIGDAMADADAVVQGFRRRIPSVMALPGGGPKRS